MKIRTSLFNAIVTGGMVMGALAAYADNTTTNNFVHDVSIANAFEIESSKVALDKSQNDAVKKFAQKMVDDHTKAGEKFKTAIETSKTDAKPEPTLDQKHQVLLENLKTQSGDVFDKRYISAQLEAHKDAVNLFNDYSRSGDEGPLKDFARETAPILEEHLKHVKSIKL